MKWNPDIIHFHYPNPFVSILLFIINTPKTKLYLHWHLDITKQKNIYPFIKPIEATITKKSRHDSNYITYLSR